MTYRYATVVVDIETSGSDSRKHSLASIGAVSLDNPENTFYIECQQEPKTSIDPDALKVNGFTYRSLNDRSKPTALGAIDRFLEWCKASDGWILASWSEFDFNFLHTKAFLYRLNWHFGWGGKLDIRHVVLAKYMELGVPLPERTLPLEQALEFAGIPGRNGATHNGLEDAKLETELLYRVIHGRPLFERFQDYRSEKLPLKV